MKINPEEIEVRYANWISMTADIIKPKNLYVIGGRGTAKTTDMMAKRMPDVVYDMPGSTMGLIADTFVNAITNVIPELTGGLMRQKYYENVHYVLGKEPPSFFKKSRRKIMDYKYTISWNNGVNVLVKSLDRPSVNAGISVVHLFGDEAKYDSEEKINKAFPTLRGDSILYGRSHYFMGHSFFTDRPNPNNKEFDWIERMVVKMDMKQLFIIFQTALIVNKIEWELYIANKKKYSGTTIKNITTRLNRWKARLLKIRYNSTMFVLVSTLANIDILTFEYLINQYETLNYEEFKTAILSMIPSLSAGEKFYYALKEKHFYNDGYNYEYYDSLGLSSNISATCAGLKYIQPNKNLEASADFGNMCSMLIGQDQGEYNRLLKNLYTLSPDYIDDLGELFVKFFEPHQRKQLHLYYDRAANNYEKSKKDQAGMLKHAIEYDRTGKRTGWLVTLMSRGQGNIAQSLEYDMVNEILNENNPKLPKFIIDKNECPELKCSLELAPAKKVVYKKGKTGMAKVKTSEQLPIAKLPRQSTNMSDAFKYYIMRKKTILIFRKKV